MYLKLEFVAGERPGDIRANICLRDSGAVVTTRIAGVAELDAQIDQLRAELEQIRKDGHRKFAEAKAAWSAAAKSN